MSERPKPTASMITDVTGGNSYFIADLYAGLYEVPMKGVYPYLDLNELVAFVVSARSVRNASLTDVKNIVYDNNSLYGIYDSIIKKSKADGFKRLNRLKNITPANEKNYAKLNPFEGQRLEERLSIVPAADVSALKDQLLSTLYEHVFECQYYDRKARLGGDNSTLHIMNFQNKYPKSGKVVPAYAAQIARMFSAYSKDSYDLPAVVVVPEVPKAPEKFVQGDLFSL